jgi:mannosyltransferase
MSEFNRYYNEALCLLYPSEYEGFGLPVIEAQKAGCPVIAQQSSSIPEVIGGGWMAHPHSAQLVDEMVEIVKQIQSRSIEAEIEKGIHHAAQFSWDKTYEQTKAIYTKIINQ